jgi:HK97 gp10 family phage protein
MSSITITGLKELSEMLTQIAPKAAKSYMVKVQKPAAQVIIDAFEASAPYSDQPHQHWALRDSIVKQSKWGTGDSGGESLITTVGPNKHVPWGMWQEFGTSHIAGKHWMGTAWSGCQDEVLNVYMEGINELFAKMIARDRSEAMIENDEEDRGSNSVSHTKLRKDRNAAHKENNDRNRVSNVMHSSGISKSENQAYAESKHRA